MVSGDLYGGWRENFAAIVCLTWYAGLRIHECFRIDTATAEQALRENAITIKGKSGKIRTVPINGSISIELKKLLAVTPRGHKLFVPGGVPTDIAIARLQQYIYQVRPQIQDEGSIRPMTHHSLRHTYITNLLLAGVDVKTVQYLAGHEHAKITLDVYAHLTYNRPEDLLEKVNRAFSG